ncbi:hypothetical protein [Ancylobacter polymorphus]|uniref:Uncharacterized protein n=1 Tax=Ancylobacter polymorphus TaxID=223390 RepID=A0A9E7CW09_9HYPH|nr:hypothetical protein [Ancylobacter polymorphus]UOK70299.1 hypothetical protein K9D25_16425 [Ancylobacter polymorphus]
MDMLAKTLGGEPDPAASPPARHFRMVIAPYDAARDLFTRVIAYKPAFASRGMLTRRGWRGTRGFADGVEKPKWQGTESDEAGST